MTQRKRELPVLLPTKGRVRYILRALYSITNFAKASVLSIAIILVILMLLTQMEQAFTMLLRMLEEGRFSLLLCFLLINLLAVSLSHYPIYTYYAGNLNQSRKYVSWRKERPFKKKWLKWLVVYTFKPINDRNYVKDIYANILRQYLGLAVYVVWAIFIYHAFLPNLEHTLPTTIEIIKWSSILFACLTFFSYGYYKRKLSPLHSTLAKRSVIYKRVGIYYFFSSGLSIVLFTWVIFKGSLFSPGGLILLLMANFSMMLNFSFFRLVRPRLRHVLRSLKNDGLRNSVFFLSILRRVEKSSNYLVAFVITFYIALLAIIYFTIASMNGQWPLPNGIVIVLVYLYFYFFIISALGKYFFVKYSMSQKLKEAGQPLTFLNSGIFRFTTTALLVLAAMLIMGLFTESRLNELTIYPIEKEKDGIAFDDFKTRVAAMPDTVFFISSHGGGLKANTWTLMVLDELQKESNNQLMDRTVAMSGASGGSLGLALYGAIYGNHKNQPNTRNELIDKIRRENYASVDISLLFGADLAQIFFPFNMFTPSHDRSYYGMLKYQRILQNDHSTNLNPKTYRKYWKELGENSAPLPALIMNTASTNGKRGIFCTVNTPQFDSIFPYAQNLSDLKMENGKDGTVSFFQAVSTTNRFPVFSPVAKIKGSGHFIDAGAIDNSGILGCWDMFLYLFDHGILEGKTIIFIDIDNSKSGYAELVFDEFLQSSGRDDFLVEENEKSSLGANLQTGLSLNKIPGYLNDFLSNYSTRHDFMDFKRIMLPHKVSIADIETVIDGEICDLNLFNDAGFRAKLQKYLDKHNKQIFNATEGDKSFFEDWNSYEPVLSRQLSLSNITYYDSIISNDYTGIGDVISCF